MHLAYSPRAGHLQLFALLGGVEPGPLHWLVQAFVVKPYLAHSTF